MDAVRSEECATIADGKRCTTAGGCGGGCVLNTGFVPAIPKNAPEECGKSAFTGISPRFPFLRAKLIEITWRSTRWPLASSIAGCRNSWRRRWEGQGCPEQANAHHGLGFGSEVDLRLCYGLDQRPKQYQYSVIDGLSHEEIDMHIKGVRVLRASEKKNACRVLVLIAVLGMILCRHFEPLLHGYLVGFWA